MRDLWTQIMDNFQSYIGTGIGMWMCFLVANAVCFFLSIEWRKKLFTITCLLMFVVFNPLVYWIVGTRFLSGIYWRLFWVFPTTMAIAAVLTELASRIGKRGIQLIVVGAMCLFIAKMGTSVINTETYSKPSNDYQLPQYVIDVANRILMDTDGRETRIVASDAINFYIRQYTAKISLGYGRDIYGYISAVSDWEQELYNLMCAEEIDFDRLYEVAKTCDCSYIVFDNSFQKLPQDMKLLGYEFVDQVDNRYLIYSLE